MPRTRRGAALATIAALCVLLPAGALAQGGGSGGGGTPPPPSGAPCVTLAPSNSGATFNRFKPIKARYAVANCSTAAVTVSLDATSVSTAWAPIPIVPTPVPCAGASATLGAITLRAGAQNTVEFSVPAPATCPVGPGGAILQVDAVASGVGLKPLTSTAFYQIALKN